MANEEKPHVYVPPGEAPPTELVIDDIVVGDGDEAKSGMPVDVHYVGVAWSTRKQFDSSWDRGDTFGFRLGADYLRTLGDAGGNAFRVAVGIVFGGR